MTLRAARDAEASLLIQAPVGMVKPAHAEYYARIRSYEAVLSRYPKEMAKLSLLTLADRAAGARETLLRVVVCKNYGCSHFIANPDQAAGDQGHQGAAPGSVAAQSLFETHQKEIGITVVPFRSMVYVPDKDAYVREDELPEDSRGLYISDAELHSRLSEGREIPSGFTFPEVARELRHNFPPRAEQGFTIFFTGLSGAGKSTVANILLVKFLEMSGRPVTLLDGDIVRKHLSSELGFSREHRDINIRRIGFVASEITKNGGIAICAPIAPYDAVRKQVRTMIQPLGGFILVHLTTALDVLRKARS